MKSESLEERPAAVSEGTKQAGEIREKWNWVEPTVWTERMLMALEEGVKGGKWYSLMDKVYALANLRSAFKKVKAKGGAPGVDHQTIEMFGHHLEENLERLSQSLKEQKYRPQAIRRVWIPKAGSKEKRPLGIPTVRDRVVQTALLHVLEPIFEKEFAQQSYGFRPHRGCKDALRQIDHLLKRGKTWVVDVDVRSYFDTIPHEPLMERVEERVADGRVLELLRVFLRQGVMETANDWRPEEGTPQGAVISPLLANIYLNPLDQGMDRDGGGMVRYADDFVLLCDSQTQAEGTLEQVRRWVEEAGLRLHPEKTRIVDATKPGGFDFLGYHFEQGKRWPRRRSLRRLKDLIRAKAKRTNGYSLEMVILRVNRTLMGWFEYFKHSHKTTFPPLDGWIRMRLRSILRKRQHRKGRARGRDHQRWPNAFFTEQGLFSLVTAHAQVCQPSKR
ncbi:MAG: group II intron reverse transcriptase/maturase [Deltaproteobacteria bacterium]